STANLSKRTAGKDIIRIEFSRNIDSKKLMKIKGVMAVTHIEGKQWKIEASQEKDIREDIFKFAVEHKTSVLSLNLERQSLEEVFQALTTPAKPKV
ncbi:MAG TPA: DUF4162 domain-containing protein, partial [Bacteroidales bacterium]|nr:DUF4162 domain-containing protein [Bacteroidales bacterium]